MKRFWFILSLMLLMAVAQVRGAQSLNLLENGSFELPIVPPGDGNIPTPGVDGWNISGAYWAIFTADNGGIIPIPDGYNELYLYVCSATQQVCKIVDNCNYEFSLKVAANGDLAVPQSSFAVIEAISPDGSRVYELDKTYFSVIDTSYFWYTFNLSYNNLPGSMLAGYDLRVRIYASGMLNVDNAVLKVTTDQVIIDDFESYQNQLELQENWVAQVGGGVSLENEFESRFLGHQAMKFGYTYPADGFSEVEYDMTNCLFGKNLQQGLSGQLALSFCGNHINSPGGQLYLELKDFGGNTYTIYSNTDPADENWQLWVIDISDFYDAGVNATDISKLILGVRDTQNTAGSGVVYIDNIELPIQSKKAFSADIAADGIVDFEDLLVLVQNWLMAY